MRGTGVLNPPQDFRGRQFLRELADFFVIGIAEFVHRIGANDQIVRVEVFKEVPQSRDRILLANFDRPLQVLRQLAIGSHGFAPVRIQLHGIVVGDDQR